MAIHYPGTFEVRTFFTTDEPSLIASHEIRWSCEMAAAADPGDPFSDWSVSLRGGGSSPLDTEVDNFMAFLEDMYSTAVDFSHAELWEYSPGTFDSVFRSSYTLGLSGVSASPTVIYSQTILSFRSTLGGIMKLDMRGTDQAKAAKTGFPSPSTAVNNLAAWVASATTPVRARDGGFPMSPLFFLPGLNERAEKKVLR